MRTPLRIYGPGGPYEAIRECCDLYTRETGVTIQVHKGRPDLWAAEARDAGDIVYNGAPYMMTDFDHAYPGTIDPGTMRAPFRRRIGILVRRHNPRGILSLPDLGDAGIRLLSVELEKMDTFIDAFPGCRGNIAETVVTGEEGFATWLDRPDIDAWITYRSWHAALGDQADFIDLPGVAGTLRSTPWSLTLRTRRSEEAFSLLDHWGSEAAHAIFQKWGWE